ncbi:MAG TPA: neutral/alkaline non-lysosomal ceramidase N-terminal domain-containing protein [Lacipirellulaceae bacterium]|nr:neutral/alkaline non-lysosomal ceramidase N-terminal domain-containing protein [Lacipirellulaceae bacterium]
MAYCLAVVGFIASLGVAAPVSAADALWKAGVAKVDITPEVPIWLSGYASRNKPANSIRDHLWAKALVIEDANGHRGAIVTMDLIGIPREISQTVCKQAEDRYKLPRAAIVLNTSHTHSGPVVRGNLMAMYSLDEDQTRRINEFRSSLVDKLVSVIGDAIQTMKPAKLAWGIGEAAFAVNRRNNKEGQVPKLREEGKLVGPSDHELPVLTVTGEDGELRAIVAGYACHATVMGDYFVTADWPGAGQNELQKRHPGAIAMFVNGCSGDQNPLPRHSMALVQKYGEEFADGVDAAIKAGLKPITPTLRDAYEEIALPFDKLPTRAELETTTTAARPQGPWAKYMLAEWDREGGLPATYPYPVQAWQLGDNLTWVFLGGEVVVDYSLRLKSELPAKEAWISGYSNDVMAYIPSRRVLGEGGYEGGLARFPYGLPAVWDGTVEEKIVDEAHKVVDRVRER